MTAAPCGVALQRKGASFKAIRPVLLLLPETYAGND